MAIRRVVRGLHAVLRHELPGGGRRARMLVGCRRSGRDVRSRGRLVGAMEPALGRVTLMSPSGGLGMAASFAGIIQRLAVGRGRETSLVDQWRLRAVLPRV